jgi:hypothetical protein
MKQSWPISRYQSGNQINETHKKSQDISVEFELWIHRMQVSTKLPLCRAVWVPPGCRVCTQPARDADVGNYCSLSTHRPAVIIVPLLRLPACRTLAHTARWILHIVTLYGTTVIPNAHTTRWILHIATLYGTTVVPNAHTTRWILHIVILYGTTVVPNAHTARRILHIVTLHGTTVLPNAHTTRWILHIVTLHGTTVVPNAHTTRWILHIGNLQAMILPNTGYLTSPYIVKSYFLFYHNVATDAR